MPRIEYALILFLGLLAALSVVYVVESIAQSMDTSANLIMEGSRNG